jgi:hypothetical protein
VGTCGRQWASQSTVSRSTRKSALDHRPGGADKRPDHGHVLSKDMCSGGVTLTESIWHGHTPYLTQSPGDLFLSRSQVSSAYEAGCVSYTLKSW